MIASAPAMVYMPPTPRPRNLCSCGVDAGECDFCGSFVHCTMHHKVDPGDS